MPKIKKESRQFIVINEEKLISEVEKRSILYDKALKGYRKPAIRETAWQEVANNLDSTVEECKKRWRSLRDAFMKQYKSYSRGDSHSKKPWLFYEQMEFLGPYFDTSEEKFGSEEYIETITADTESDDKPNPNQQIVCINTDVAEYSHQIEVEEYNEDQELEDTGLDSSQYAPVTLNNSSNKKGESSSSVYYITGTNNHSTPSNDVQMQNSPRQTKPTPPVSAMKGSNEHFMLSCVANLERLSTKKCALARLRIQQLLFEIEFEDD